MEIFPTLKTSLATLVRKVKSGLTAGRDETQPEMIAVVRLSVRRGVRTRIDVHMQLYMALFTLFAISFAGLIWVAALVIVLFMQLTVIPIVQWEVLLRHAPQELLPSLFADDPETWVRIQLFFELEGALFVTFFILALILSTIGPSRIPLAPGVLAPAQLRIASCAHQQADADI